MPRKNYKTPKPEDHSGTIVKSGLTGVAATCLAVALSSPAGLGGMIGTSIASGDNDMAVDLPETPQPLSTQDLNSIRSQLALSSAEMDNMRAATDGKIDMIRAIAQNQNVLAFAEPSADYAEAEPVEAPDANRHAELAQLLLRDTLS